MVVSWKYLESIQYVHSCRGLYWIAKAVGRRLFVFDSAYRAYEPSCSCSSPPGNAFHSLCGRPWGCRCWRSLSPWQRPCSPPRVGAGRSAGRWREEHICPSVMCDTIWVIWRFLVWWLQFNSDLCGSRNNTNHQIYLIHIGQNRY